MGCETWNCAPSRNNDHRRSPSSTSDAGGVEDVRTFPTCLTSLIAALPRAPAMHWLIVVLVWMPPHPRGPQGHWPWLVASVEPVCGRSEQEERERREGRSLRRASWPLARRVGLHFRRGRCNSIPLCTRATLLDLETGDLAHGGVL